MRGPVGNPQLLRTMNERLLLDYLRERGPASRGDLAKATGLSKPTVSAALAGLEAAGLVHQIGSIGGRPGPATAIYDMNASAGQVAGIDIGRDWIRLAVADLRGSFIARRDVRNTARASGDLVRKVRQLADSVTAEIGMKWTEITHATIGSPGVLNQTTGRLELAPNLPGWGRPGLVDKLRSALEIDLVIENDINLAAVGELTAGAGQGVANFVMVSVGTGVGMGIVINGELYVGARGAAGEVAFLPADSEVPDDEVRQHGMTEAVAAAGGIAWAAKRAGLAFASAKEIFAAAAAGDTRALAVVEAEGRRIGALLIAVVAILDPELVVLGGGIGRNLSLLGDAISRRIEELGPLRPSIVASTLGDSGVLHGAVARALDVARDRLFTDRSRSGAP